MWDMRWMFLALALGGCTTATAVMGPDGTPHYDVHCPRSMVACYQRAAEACPRGYDLINATTSVDAITPTANGPVGGGSSTDMLIRCRTATAAR
jgi:hypothetical protein